VIDFNTDGAGNFISPNTYVRRQWESTHGMQVRVQLRDGGYSPYDRARILDTSNPGTEPHLGSPNIACPGGGPGIGSGGSPANENGENCASQGNVLIVQESNSTEAHANPGGGVIVFQFDSPTPVGYIGLMGIVDGTANIRVVTHNNTFVVFPFEGRGENSVQAVPINQPSVKYLRVWLMSTGAVTEIGLYIPRKVSLFEQSIPELTTKLSTALTNKVIEVFGSIPGGCLENTTIAIDVTMAKVNALAAQCSDVAGAVV
jgi:hypothetical protein